MISIAFPTERGYFALDPDGQNYVVDLIPNFDQPAPATLVSGIHSVTVAEHAVLEIAYKSFCFVAWPEQLAAIHYVLRALGIGTNEEGAGLTNEVVARPVRVMSSNYHSPVIATDA